jgi:hypothetical protein
VGSKRLGLKMKGVHEKQYSASNRGRERKRGRVKSSTYNNCNNNIIIL